MRTYCKDIDITDPTAIEKWVDICVSDPRKKHRNGFVRLMDRYGDAHGIAVEITKRIKARNLDLPPIQHREARDKSSGKIRNLGIESAMQQCMDYVAVYALMPMLKAKVGTYQCASVPNRGQVYGKRSLEKWIRRDHKGTKYYDKMDIKHCYESIDHEVVRRLLKRDIGKNPTLVWFTMELVKTYDKGLSIGSYLSQWLCNYIMSYAYHYVSESLCKERRGKRMPLVHHVLMFMDDIILFGSSKRDLKVASKALAKYFKTNLGLTVKPNHHAKQTELEPPDMMGFVVGRKRTTIRARIFKRARRVLLRARRKLLRGRRMPIEMARKIVSYAGYFKHTDSFMISKKLHLAELKKAAQKVVSDFQKGVNKNASKSRV